MRRPRFTIRALMVAVAGAAVLAWVGAWLAKLHWMQRNAILTIVLVVVVPMSILEILGRAWDQ